MPILILGMNIPTAIALKVQTKVKEEDEFKRTLLRVVYRR